LTTRSFRKRLSKPSGDLGVDENFVDRTGKCLVHSLISSVLVNQSVLWGVVGFAVAALFIMGLKWFLLAGIVGVLAFGRFRALFSKRPEYLRTIEKRIGR
jgi:hypothetical protein